MFSKAKDLGKWVFPTSAASNEAASSCDQMSENCSDKVTVYKGSRNPTKSWKELSVKQICKRVSPMPLNTPIFEDKIRFVFMSDTHNRTKRMPDDAIPMGDVYLHAGDFSMTGTPEQVEEFNNFLGELPHPHKIVIAGNHELSFDPYLVADKHSFYGSKTKPVSYLKERGLEKMSDVLTNCTYLEDAEVTVAGIKVYGSPWQPEFGNWAFNLERGQRCLDVWDMIPKGVDILMTHGPPVGHGDSVRDGGRAGCVELLNTIQRRVKPKYHLFGHIHEGYGITTDGHTTFINGSTCNLKYQPLNPPVIFDLPLPPGASKQDITAPIKSGLHIEREPETYSSDESVEFKDMEEDDEDL